MADKNVTIISLGCSKNLVDSERLARRFEDAGYAVRFGGRIPRGAVVVLNTCGFIGDAKEESVNTVLEALQLKQLGKVSAVYVMGCLSERYRKQLPKLMPELDGIYGKFDWAGIVDALTGEKMAVKPWERKLSAPSYSAYVKISEGCNRFCAYCAIPLITGRHRSRPAAEILDEVRALVAGGTREFNIIAQDLSSYGCDLKNAGAEPLAELIDAMACIKGVEMIRLHYAYPSDFPYGILPVMARHSNVCKYLDLALQHIDDDILTAMRRHITAAETRELLARIRREVPGIHIRTTMMVGFPGETEEAFERLLDFVREQRFERLGAFAYCEEEGTYAAKHLPDSIDEDVKQDRLSRLMAVQEEIAEEIAAEKIGSIQRVMIDSYDKTRDCYEGRTEFDSPEVDPCVFVHSDKLLRKGKIYNVKITGTEFIDLEGHVVVE